MLEECKELVRNKIVFGLEKISQTFENQDWPWTRDILLLEVLEVEVNKIIEPTLDDEVKILVIIRNNPEISTVLKS